MTHSILSVEELPAGEFGFPGPQRDTLVAAIMSGEKTATSSLVYEYEAFEEKIPEVGDMEAVVDTHGIRVCVIANTEVEVVPLGEVTLEHALAEGEGFESVADWRAAHEKFWGSKEYRKALGENFQELTDDTPVYCVKFRKLF